MTDFIPPYQDIATLARHTCLGERTIEEWVKRGKLPAPKVREGKRLWKWKEVEAALDGQAPLVPSSDIHTRIREATRRAAAES